MGKAMGKSAPTRFERSAAALRENLKRRKAAAASEPVPPPAPQAAQNPPENGPERPQ
jgi:hypothetical protein